MIKKLIPKTIRSKIIASTAGAISIIAAITIAVCFWVFQSFLRRNQIQSAEYNLQVASRNVSENLENILYFSTWCYSNADIIRYLEAFQNQVKMPSISSDKAYLRATALNSYERLKEEYHNTHSCHRYITRTLISPANRRNYLQISDTSSSSSSTIADDIYQCSFFQSLLENDHYRWIGFIPDPLTGKQQILPIVRPIYNQYNSQIIGWCYLSVSSRIILDYLDDFPLMPDSSLFVQIGNISYQYKNDQFIETALPFSVSSPIQDATLSPKSKAEKIRLEDGSKRTMVTCPLNQYDWSISYILSETDFHKQRQVYWLIILGISCVIACLGFGLYLLLDRAINYPVKKIQAKISLISRGDFSREPSIEWEDEFGAIGKGINNMAENVMSLMERRVEDEKQKKDLEYQILQSQINPHFLYNTLNSIKWMATIQNATGIAEMTTALARLLKNVSKGTSTQIPLKEELELAEDYFLIQQYRYGGSISIEYVIASEDLYLCLIHRFTLQPIIENALFHGIEPKGCAGKILVDVVSLESSRLGKIIRISITDNGIGMSPEMIQNVLYGDGYSSSTFFKHVGIQNVNKRIQYTYGEDYGITIESKLGEYTTMTITLPYQTAEGNENEKIIDCR